MFSTLGYIICVPFAWLVRSFYQLTGSYGMAIILFTLVVKLILLPFQWKSKKSMMRMTRMNGKLQEIQKKYANNQVKQAEEMQKLYAEEGINPMSGCLWSFLPLPILMALYSIIRQPITHFMTLTGDVVQDLVAKVAASGADLTGIVHNWKDGVAVLEPYGQINLVRLIETKMPELADSVDGWIDMHYDFIGIDLSRNPWDVISDFHFEWAVIGLLLIPIITGLSQLLMTVMTMKQQPNQGAGTGSTKVMMYMMPLMTVWFAFIMPAALGIYWIAQSVFSLIQEAVLGKYFKNKMDKEEEEKEAAELADRQRRIEEGRKRQQEQKKHTEQHKASLREKQKAAQKAKAVKAAKAKTSTNEAGRVGDRAYARGRSYQEDRYDK